MVHKMSETNTLFLLRSGRYIAEVLFQYMHVRARRPGPQICWVEYEFVLASIGRRAAETRRLRRAR